MKTLKAAIGLGFVFLPLILSIYHSWWWALLYIPVIFMIPYFRRFRR